MEPLFAISALLSNTMASNTTPAHVNMDSMIWIMIRSAMKSVGMDTFLMMLAMTITRIPMTAAVLLALYSLVSLATSTSLHTAKVLFCSDTQ